MKNRALSSLLFPVSNVLLLITLLHGDSSVCLSVSMSLCLSLCEVLHVSVKVKEGIHGVELLS